MYPNNRYKMKLFFVIMVIFYFERQQMTDSITTTTLPHHSSKIYTSQAPTAFNMMSGINATFLSKVYRDLMMKYDKKFRPDFQQKATAIALDFHVLSFDNLNEGSMEYGIDFYFAQMWFDKRLMLPNLPGGAIINLIGKDVEEVWLPDTVFVNSKYSKFHQVTISNRFLSLNMSNGRIVYHSRITTLASCTLDLRHYPFDQQTCYLAIESYGYDKSEVSFFWINWRTRKECDHEDCLHIHVYDRDMSNFYLLSAFKSKNSTSYNADTFSSASTVFKFRRRSLYFVFQIYLPSSLIVMVAWASFWITPKAVPARIAICVTTILTLVTMMGIANVNMPRVSYVKALDLYLLVSCLFVFSALFEFVIVLNTSNSCVYKFFGCSCRCQLKVKIKKEKRKSKQKRTDIEVFTPMTTKAKEDKRNFEMKENHDPNFYTVHKNGGIPTSRENKDDEIIKIENNKDKERDFISSDTKEEEESDNEYKRMMEKSNNENQGNSEHDSFTKTCLSDFDLCKVTCRKRRSKKEDSENKDDINSGRKKGEKDNVNECLSFSALLDLVARIIFPVFYFCFVFGYYIKYKECDIS